MKATAWICGVAVIAGLAILPLAASTFTISLTLSIVMYAGLALSWAMFSGATGYIALSTSAFFGIGAYTCAVLVGSWPWPAVIACGALVAGLLAFLLGVCVLHLRGTYFAILTFGISELLKNLIMYIERSQFGSVGRVVSGAPQLPVIYWTVLALGIIAMAVYWAVARSDFGAALRAIGSDEGRAATLGLNVRNAKIAGFCLSALIPGAIGAAMSVRWTYIEPQIVFNPFIVFPDCSHRHDRRDDEARRTHPRRGRLRPPARNPAVELRALLPDLARRAPDPFGSLHSERTCESGALERAARAAARRRKACLTRLSHCAI